MKKGTVIAYTGLAVFLAAAVLLIWSAGTHRALPETALMKAAAEKLRLAEEAVKEERLARSLPLSEEDRLQIGLIGSDYSAITTTLGNAEAKRTAQLPDMAALCVRLFTEAGLKVGDRIGACFSGSFPGLDLAVLCAAETMGIEIVYTVGIGASTYGANLPEYTAPEMIQTAVQAGVIHTMPAVINLGGEGNNGLSMLGVLMEETEEIDEMRSRLAEEGLVIEEAASQAEEVKKRTALYGEIAAFVNVGGNPAGAGKSDFTLHAGQGLLEPQKVVLTEKSGLIETYLDRSVPVIQFLNVKQLCLEYGITFDPAVLPETGTEALYFENRYSRPLILAAGLAVFAALVFIRRQEEKQKSKDPAEKP